MAMKTNIYTAGKLTAQILEAVTPPAGITCRVSCLTPGINIDTDTENIIIIKKLPPSPADGVKYVLCSKSPADLTPDTLSLLYDLWPEPLTPSLLKFHYTKLLERLNAEHINASEERRHNRRIMEMARQDYLTGLATRWYLQEYIASNQDEDNVTCIYFDLDNFKAVNDTYGHQAGDRALAATAEMMQNEFTDGFCARMGGDEFMIVLAGERDIADVRRKVNDFMKNLLNYYATTRTMKKLSVSAGISQRQSAHTKTIDRLIHESDLALYEAKKAGRACCRVYDSSMEKTDDTDEHDDTVHEAITNYYLVDYENVKNHAFNGLENMSVHDEICIFYSDNALGSFTVELHNQMNESKARIITRKATVGTKNALDFQLAAYLGELIAQNNAQCNYFIVSNDKGYESLISFGRERHVNVKIIPNLSGTLAASDEMKHDVSERIKSICTVLEINEVAKIIANSSSKTEINGELGKFFKDSHKSGEVYRAIRPLLANKKGHS
ncbi:MAG: diguanylate cyclase [Synergistaceae bacterium]|nr:diguanylate cyclase [Synergistaceae bacterium]